MAQDFYLVTFPSTHFVIKMDHLLKDQGLKTSVIGTPGQIKAGCGLSLRVPLDDKAQVIKQIELLNTAYESIYLVKRQAVKNEYISIS